MAWTTPETAVAGQVLTAAYLNTNLVANTNALYESVRRFGYQSRSGTDYSITQTVVTSAADIFTSDITWTADGTSVYLVEFYCGEIYTGDVTGASAVVHLVNGAGTSIVPLGRVAQGNTSNNTRAVGNIFARYFYTPSAGSVSINARGIYTVSAAGGVAIALASGQAPTYLAVYGPVLT